MKIPPSIASVGPDNSANDLAFGRMEHRIQGRTDLSGLTSRIPLALNKIQPNSTESSMLVARVSLAHIAIVVAQKAKSGKITQPKVAK